MKHPTDTSTIDMFDKPSFLPHPRKLARRTDPSTSHVAATQVDQFATRHYGEILSALQTFGPKGKDGIALLTGLDSSQVSRRMPELAKLGLVRLTGQLTKSKSGRAEREWQFINPEEKS
jgi:predicted transcriptional regulator